MATVSKNQRRGTKVQIHTHKDCGGTIKMKGIFNKRLRWIATCDKCEQTGRRPTDFALASSTYIFS